MHDRPDPVYIMGRSDPETVRLQQQSRLYGPATRRLFEDAGIAPGMKVLDIGSGAGDVALLAAELVGPGGEVVGVDANAAILDVARSRAQAAGFDHARFVAGDIRTIDLDPDFDAVVGRLVLVYLADPAAVVARLVRRLRPGAIVALQEFDWSIGPASRPPAPSLAQIWDWAKELFRRCGLDPYVGLGLNDVFRAAGLAAPDMRLDAPAGGGADFAGYAYLENSVRSGLPQLIATGVASAEEVAIDALARRLRDEIGDGVMALPAMVGAWARTPGACA